MAEAPGLQDKVTDRRPKVVPGLQDKLADPRPKGPARSREEVVPDPRGTWIADREAEGRPELLLKLLPWLRPIERPGTRFEISAGMFS
jgi:hypothetical protein